MRYLHWIGQIRDLMKAQLLAYCMLTGLLVKAQWQATNNPNTQIQCIAAEGSTVLIGTGGGGVYVSTDNADTWSSPSDCCSDFVFPYIWCTAIEGSEFYAGTTSGLYRSVDGGATWDPINNGLTGADTMVSAILRDDTTLFAALQSGVFRSFDNGANWTNASVGFTGNARALARHGAYLFAGSAGAGVFRSLDNGDNWAAASVGLTNGVVNDFQSVGADLFVATNEGVFRSTDNGDTWTAVNSGILTLTIWDLLLVNGHLYAASMGGGIYVSTDNGASWSTDNAGLTYTSMSSLAAGDTYMYTGVAAMGDVFRHALPAVGLDEGVSGSLIRVYPTLTTGEVIIEDKATPAMDRTVCVIDALGRTLKTIRIGYAQRASLYLDGTAGPYNLEIRSADRRVASYRVVKQ
ncbi:MAG: hypothetical protein IPL77_04815 [Flavobacteriales bacterium]|jgi:photosystem II stability/assembly factor-like uncharacterized protein|nr:hypothetical protein [Flavobacteriales bacterium]